MNRTIAICLLGILSFSGCQAAPPAETESVTTQEFLPTPSIKGPTEPPNVKGPTSPPPGSEGTAEDSPQAITEVETVEYTLPTSTEADFKNEY